MPGPTPKDPSLRQRRNKSVSKRTLYLDSAQRTRMPSLPSGREWNAQTEKWWYSVWHSPMSDEYLDADIPSLLVLAVLIDTFWKEPSVPMAAEIRQRQQAFGLTPLDRRRLEWQVVQVEDAKEKREVKRSRRALVISDPREVLG